MYNNYNSESESSEDEADATYYFAGKRSETPKSEKSPTSKVVKSNKFVTAATKMPIGIGTTAKICGESSSFLSVEPGILHFESVQPGILYVMTMSIRNMSQGAERIRIRAPRSGLFALNYIPSGVVSPGLDIRAQVECQLPEGTSELEFYDSITVTMGPHTLEVPIVATKQFASIKFDPLVNFGFVAKGFPASREISFQNVSSKTGTVKFIQRTPQSLVISPSRFSIEPGQCVKVTMTLGDIDAGVWREAVEVQIDGALKNELLDVNAHCVAQKLSLLSTKGGGILEEVDFGNMFYGEKRTISALLVNSGPEQLSFNVNYIDEGVSKPSTGRASKTPVPDADEALNSPETNSLTLSPAEGIIKPFSQVPLTICLSPELPVPSAGFQLEFMSNMREQTPIAKRAVIENIELSQKLFLNVAASVSVPDFSLNPNVLNFGSCAVNDRRDMLVELNNNSVSVVTFRFTKHAHFRIHPNEGVLEAKQSRTVIATFHPGQLGNFRVTAKVVVAGGLQEFVLSMQGDANDVGSKKVLVGGIDKGVEDFKERYNFVNPAVVDAEIKAKKDAKLKKKLDQKAVLLSSSVPIKDKDLISASTGSQTRDAIYGMVEDVSKSGEPGEYHPLTLKRQNDQPYNIYLQASHAQRIEKKKASIQRSLTLRGGINRSDPFGVDMGMERGLDEPVMALPPVADELWLASRANRGDGKGRLPFDENRLIQRKYSDVPSTQAELRDCSTELNQEQLKLVTAGQKALNFGRVNIGSVIAKNFAVMNDLPHSVSVKIEDLELELKQSRPEAQIIPGGAMAGFDIYFACRTLGEYRKAFTWTVNGIHNFKVLVKADVVPIELVLNKSNLVLEFPPLSLEPSLSADVTMTNPGNAPAEYLWGSSGAFQCKPEQGTIMPGKSAVMTVTWTPTAGKRNEEELGLHINSGVDQVLKVVGNIKEAKMSFEDKMLNFGTISTGIDKELTTCIRNNGQAAAVFSIEPCDERLGIKVSPKRGIVEPGDFVEITITIHPEEAVKYDRVKVYASLRGSKPIYIRLEGESIVPQIALMEESFPFGVVAVGSEWRLPMTLLNQSNIPGSLLLNFDAFPDFKPCFKASSADPMDGIHEDELGNQIVLLSPSSFAPSSKHKGNNTWKLTVAASSTMNAALIFSPLQVKTMDFKLPLQRQGMKKDGLFSRPVTAEGVSAKLSISSRVVDFGDRVVDRDPIARASYFLEVSFTNPDLSNGLTYEIRERESEPAPSVVAATATKSKTAAVPGAPAGISPAFFISPMRGNVGAGSWSPIRVTFQPQDSISYTKIVDVYIVGHQVQDRPYATLICRGTGAFPRLSFDRQHLLLPTVPLGVTSRALFSVINNGYGTLELRYRISPTIPIPLDISFPDGAEVGLSVHKVSVVVAAKSDTAIAWSGKIEFYDNDGERFSLVVGGCSDNSIFTNYSFVKAFSASYAFIGLDEHPVRYLPRDQVEKLREQETARKEALRKQRLAERQQQATEGNEKAGSMTERSGVDKAGSSTEKAVGKSTRRISIPDFGDFREGVEISPDIQQLLDNARYNEMECSSVLKWLNAFVCRRPFDNSRFPECILENNGDVVVECLEQLSGQKIPGVRTSQAELEARRSHGVVNEAPQNPASGGAGAANSTNTNPPSRAATAAEQKQSVTKTSMALRLLEKYRTMLQFVIKYGGLLAHIDPGSLLSYTDYLLVQEHDLRIREGARFTHSILKENIAQWESRWQSECRYGWLELLLQAIKVFSAARVTYKELQKLPGIIVAKREDPAAATRKSKGGQTKEKLPPDFTMSNVYSNSELVLMAWASYHLQRSVNLRDEGVPESATPPLVGLKRRVSDLELEFGDFFAHCQILHSHIPELTKPGASLSGYSFQHQSGKKDEYYSRLQETLRDIRMSFDASKEEFSASARVHMLVLLQFFFALPTLAAKTTIEFSGLVGVPLVKTIELRNPSKRAVRYEISLRGSPFYSVDADEITLPAESIVDVPVTLRSRFLAPASAQITFWGLRDGGIAGSTMVFQLMSAITGRAPVETIKKTLNVFEWDTYQITIRNPYPSDGVFPLTLRTFHTPMVPDDAIKVLLGKPIKKKPGKEAPTVEIFAPEKRDEDAEIESLFKLPFWCDGEQQLNLPAGGSQVVTVHVLPFLLGTYSCQLVFADPLVGEFCYEIVLDVDIHKAGEKLEFHTTQMKKGQVRKALRLASRNVMFEKAVAMITDHRLGNPNKKLRAKSVLQSCLASHPLNEETGEAQFAVEFISPVFSSIKTIGFVSEYIAIVHPEGKEKSTAPRTAQSHKYSKMPRSFVEELAANDSEKSLNTAIISFQPEKVGAYQGRAVVYSLDNSNDIRVVDIVANVTVPNTKMLIEFRGPAKQTISQDIPIANNQDKDLNLILSYSGRCFSGPKTLLVPKGTTVDLKVLFVSQVAGSFDGSLQLKNNEGGTVDSFVYTLLGVAGEPLAEDNLTFICKSRFREKFLIPLKLKRPDPPKVPKGVDQAAAESVDQVLVVTTDIPYITGSPDVVLTNGEGVYEFNVFCPVSGVLAGSITFNDSSSRLVSWYTVEITVASPQEESTIAVSTAVRTAASIEISLENPTTEVLKFNVALEGEGLIGDATHTIQPSASGVPSTYELIYSPLVEGAFTGKIRFLNPIVGEFWYKLQLSATPAPPTVIELVECMIACTKTVIVPIENPLQEQIQLAVSISNPEHFSIPGDIILSPYAQTSFEVIFKPSSLSDIVTSTLALMHPAFGSIEYQISGKGLMPGIMPICNIFSPLGEIGSHTINFRNPFPHPLPVDFVLSDEDVLNPAPLVKKPTGRAALMAAAAAAAAAEKEKESFAFSLLLRKAHDVVIQPKATFPIGISFDPQRLGQYTGNVQVRTSIGGLSLLWYFPLVGMAESAALQRIPRISTPCKSSLLRDVDIPLDGLLKKDVLSAPLQASDFSVEIIVEPKVQALVTRSFRAQMLTIVDYKPEEGEKEKSACDFSARYRLLFEPLRTFTTSIEMIVLCRGRGRWRLMVDLESTEPEPDDTIQLTAPVGGSDKVSFKLSNRFLGLSNFEAYFTAKSSPHFAVSPATGVLAPFGSDGTPFIVTFAPIEYGVIEIGNLVISTEEAQWNYRVTGTYPSTVIKQSAIKSKIDTGIHR